jgi:hypothetical protein
MERTTLEAAAANHIILRGLILIPFGMQLVLGALALWEVGPLRHLGVFAIAMFAVGLLTVPITRYYDDNYGRLRPSMRYHVRAAVTIVLAIVVIGGGWSLLRSDRDWSLDLPVNAVAVTIALTWLLIYAIGVGLKAHHLVIWGTLLVAGALPVWNGADPSIIGIGLAGVAFMASGVFDHRLFVATFGPPRGPDLEEGDVGA